MSHTHTYIYDISRLRVKPDAHWYHLDDSDQNRIRSCAAGIKVSPWSNIEEAGVRKACLPVPSPLYKLCATVIGHSPNPLYLWALPAMVHRHVISGWTPSAFNWSSRKERGTSTDVVHNYDTSSSTLLPSSPLRVLVSYNPIHCHIILVRWLPKPSSKVSSTPWRDGPSLASATPSNNLVIRFTFYLEHLTVRFHLYLQ